MRKLRTRLVLFAFSVSVLLLGSCRSVDWQERPQGLPAGWRDLDLHVADGAWVLARDKSAASEAYFEVREVLGHLREAGASVPRTGLIIAVSADDPPLIAGEPQVVARQLAQWHAAVVGLEEPLRGITPKLGRLSAPGPNGKKIEIDAGRLLKLFPVAVPKQDTTLELPRALVERVDWIAVMPTASCVESITDDLVDSALEQADLSLVQRMLVSVMMPMARGRVRDEFQEQMRLRLFEASFAVENDFIRHKKQFAAALSAAGINPSKASMPRAARSVGNDGIVRIGGHELGEAEHFAVVAKIPGIRFPKRGMSAITVSELPSRAQVAALSKLGFAAIVDLSGSPELQTSARENGIAYVHVPVDGPEDWTRENVERLAQAAPDPRRMTLVCSREPAHAAAIVALRACWLDQLSGKRVLQIGRTYGLGQLAAQVSLVARRGLRDSQRGSAAQVYYGDGAGRLNGIAAFADGSTVACGDFEGASLGPEGEQNVVSRGGRDGLLVVREASGEVVWSRRFGGKGHDSIDSVAVLDADSFVATGQGRGTLDLDESGPGGELEALPTENSHFVACVSREGRCRWVRKHGLRGAKVVAAGGRIAVFGQRRSGKKSTHRVRIYDGKGELQREHVFDVSRLVVDLRSNGELLVGGHRIDELPGKAGFSTGVELVRIDTYGKQVWKRQWLSRDRKHGLRWPTAVVKDARGNVTLIASLRGRVDLDPGERRREAVASGTRDICAVRLTADGDLVNWFRIGGTNDTRATACTLAPDGRLWLAGTFGGEVDLDPTDGERIAQANVSKASPGGCFVASYDATTFRLLAAEIGVAVRRSASASSLLALAPLGGLRAVGVGQLAARLNWETQTLAHWAETEPWQMWFGR